MWPFSSFSLLALLQFPLSICAYFIAILRTGTEYMLAKFRKSENPPTQDMNGSLSLYSLALSLSSFSLSISILIYSVLFAGHSTCPSSSCPQSVVQQLPCLQPNIIYNISGCSVVNIPAMQPPQCLTGNSMKDDEKASSREIIVFPKQMELSFHDIHWAWEWISIDSPGYNLVEAPTGGLSEDESIAEVLRFAGNCEYPVTGKYDISLLEADTKYEALVVLMLTEPVVGSLNLKLEPPSGADKVSDEDLKDKPLNQWFMLSLGNFTVPAVASGKIRFEMGIGTLDKGGLIIKSFLIRPVVV